MMDVLVVGGLNLDLVVQVDTLPRPGETVAGGGLALHPGGKGANQAVAAARLGARVGMLGRVGLDDFGRRLRDSLGWAGVDLTGVLDDPAEPTGVALISVDASGQNSIVVAPGANARVSPADLSAAGPLFQAAKICLMPLEVPLETVMAAAKLARSSDCTLILNAAPAQSLPPELPGLVDLLVVNELEAATLLGLSTLGQPEAAARALFELGPRHAAILTVGEQGLGLSEASRTVHLPAFPVEVVDTTAAGDAFCGGLAAALVRGSDLLEACRYGAAAGALTVTRPGAQTALPLAAEVERLLGPDGCKSQLSS